MVKLILWFLSPFLSEDNKPSIKRFLALFFAYEIHNVIQKTWTELTPYIIIILGVNLGIMIGVATYQTLTYFLKSNNNKDENDKVLP